MSKEPKGVSDDTRCPLLASEMIVALGWMIDKYGDLPVNMYGDGVDVHVTQISAYNKSGGTPRDARTAHELYLHGY